jgi:hypothetical protein
VFQELLKSILRGRNKMKSKLLLWQIGLLSEEKCPYCKKILRVSYSSKEYAEYEYFCPDKRCVFNE